MLGFLVPIADEDDSTDVDGDVREAEAAAAAVEPPDDDTLVGWDDADADVVDDVAPAVAPVLLLVVLLTPDWTIAAAMVPGRLPDDPNPNPPPAPPPPPLDGVAEEGAEITAFTRLISRSNRRFFSRARSAFSSSSFSFFSCHRNKYMLYERVVI